MSRTDRIRDYLVEEMHFEGPKSDLSDDLPLIENRVLDSMGLLRLVAWLESTYGIEIGDAEVVPANFGTLRAIDQLVAGKTTTAA